MQDLLSCFQSFNHGERTKEALEAIECSQALDAF